MSAYATRTTQVTAIGELIDLFSTTRRARVLATGAGAALALAGLTAGPAAASEAGAGTVAACSIPVLNVTGGTGTLDMTKSYIANMAANDITIVPLHPILVDTTPATYTITTWTVTGGQIDLCNQTASITYNAGSLVENTVTGKQMLLNNLTLNITGNTLDYTVQTPTGSAVIHGMTLNGAKTWGFSHGMLTYSVGDVYISQAAGTAMDNVLGTSAFTDTGLFGPAFTTTFSVSQ